MITHKLFIITCLFTFFSSVKAQNGDQVYVDDNGIMRWSADNSELHGFGVNYTLPFAHEYRMAQKSGVLPEDAIRQDVYHMARLDLDFYRVHVWDTEISDTLGNLINNDHLRLFDFTVHEMKKRGMCFIITPLAYWGNGWPESDEPTPGFSQKYGKADCLTNAGAIEAQANYLNQFLNHVNPYTGMAYKDEPHVIGFEICNEPHHNEPVENVTSFINKMVSSMRNTGCSKPVFYNMSHSIHLAEAYFNANIQGGTFQWYPTNLVANHQINGNFLPQVESYRIPFAGHPGFKKMAKIIYEFDPADAGGNILYPAMARAFREAGMQMAAQFAYDALCWAPYNTNYGTHFMNLAYAPHKAISLKIASAVFHHVAMYQKHNDNTRFDGFRISYADDLAEWVTDEKFFYSNSTASQPARLSELMEIAGCGSSPVVNYSGTGAYFLDRLYDGVWRLEVMPDAYWIDDPYSPASPDKQKAAVLHTQQQMIISLPDLGDSFTVQPVNNGNTFSPQVVNGQFRLIPGVFLLKRKTIDKEIFPDLIYKNIRIDEYVAPVSNLNKTVLWNHSPVEAVTGKPLLLHFEMVSTAPVDKIEIELSTGDQRKIIPVQPQSTNSYRVEVPGNMVVTGFLNYQIMVNDRDGITTFPSGKKGDPGSWENRDKAIYTIRLVPENAPLILWEAETDWESSFMEWNCAVKLSPTREGETALTIRLAQLPESDPLDTNDRCYAFKFFFGNKINGRSEELTQKKTLVVKTSNQLSSPQPVELGLIDKNGTVMAAEINIIPEESIFRIPLINLASAQFIVLPRPFPDFLPFRVQPNNQIFDWSSAGTLHLIVKPGNQANVDLNIERIWLE